MDTRNMRVLEGSVNWMDNNGLSSNIPGGFLASIGSEGGLVNHIDIAEDSIVIPPPVGAGESGEVIGSTAEVTSSDGDVGIGLDWIRR
jgi:hypothetical protein